MRRIIAPIVASLCFVLVQVALSQDLTILPGDDAPAILINNEKANNTSACDASKSPSYCTMALPTLTTAPTLLEPTQNNQPYADTLVVDSFPEHVSTIKINRLMYKNWTGKLICEYQPWFSTDKNTHYNGHLLIGYDENDVNTLKKQDSVMLSRGCNINLIDFYGNTDLPNQQFNLTTTDKVYLDLAGRTNYPLKFGILEDKGAFKAACQTSATITTAAQQIGCIVPNLEKDMFYIHTHYIVPNPTGLYWTDNGTYVVGYFGGCGDWTLLTCPGDWETIWSDVYNYVNNPPQNYNMKFVFQYGSFNAPLGVYTPGSFASPSISAGAYAWPQPYTGNGNGCDKASPPNCFVSNPASQDNWCDANIQTCKGDPNLSGGAYLDRFYTEAEQAVASGKMVIGLLYAGFDDSNTNVGWFGDRVVSQRCGHTLLDTANEVTTGPLGNFWGSGTGKTQIPYMQLATWNDYEEGTETESGIDNCFKTVTLTLPQNSTTMTWTLATQNDPNNETYNDPGHNYYDSIHHYVVWTTTPGGTNLSQGPQLPAKTATQYDLTGLKLKSGTIVDVYLEMIGQPSMQNEMSDNHITYTQQ